jgi:hypothetical protein
LGEEEEKKKKEHVKMEWKRGGGYLAVFLP